VHAIKEEMGSAAARYAAELIRERIARRGRVWIVVGTGSSQNTHLGHYLPLNAAPLQE